MLEICSRLSEKLQSFPTFHPVFLPHNAAASAPITSDILVTTVRCALLSICVSVSVCLSVCPPVCPCVVVCLPYVFV